MKQALSLAAVATYLISQIYPADWLTWAQSVLSLVIIFTVFRSVKPFVRILGAAFIGVGVILLAANGASWTSYILGFGSMLGVLSLFVLIPMIALPIELGQYAVSIQSMLYSKVKHSGVLYCITSLLSYVMSSFMNLATLPMVYHSIQPSLQYYPIMHKERFISRAITHGYSMPILWTPVAPIVGIIVEMTGVSWSSILPIVIPFSLLGLALDWFMAVWVASRRLKKLSLNTLEEISAARENAGGHKGECSDERKGHHPGQIVAAVLALNLLVFVLEPLTHMSFLLLVSIIVIPFAYVWSLVLGKGKAFLAKSRTLLPSHVLKMKDQFVVFLSAGFMIFAMKSTGSTHAINEGIMAVQHVLGSDLFLLIIPLIPLTLAFIGLHPAVGLALAAESLNPQALGISVQLMAIAMLTGASTAFLMGPYNATAGMMSSLIGKSAYKVSNWNAPFTIAYLLLSMLLLLILKKVG
ncbi:hypothetical protein [Bacillus sp. 3255]|uniref:hypothetical protein n=1 Tax=Bacillus sp. 3255 TaxID=2817904 RepID=UPI00286151C1|nr:hypothetical protein [Bacillus sp. 3255]MDR6881179.1 hypothetical protein [Bacillus sp. 3255]